MCIASLVCFRPSLYFLLKYLWLLTYFVPLCVQILLNIRIEVGSGGSLVCWEFNHTGVPLPYSAWEVVEIVQLSCTIFLLILGIIHKWSLVLETISHLSSLRNVLSFVKLGRSWSISPSRVCLVVIWLIICSLLYGRIYHQRGVRLLSHLTVILLHLFRSINRAAI